VGPLGGKWRPLVGKVGEWYVESWHFQGYSPRLSRLRIDGLAPTSKYWTYRSHDGVYGPSKLSIRLSIDVCLSPLLHWLAWERNWVRTHGLVSWCASLVGLGEKLDTEPWIGQSALSNVIGDPWRVAMHWPREIHMVLDHTRTEHGKRVACWSGFPLQGVHRFKSLRLSDMSNRLFVVVIT
jgi:hypothetical protein